MNMFSDKEYMTNINVVFYVTVIRIQGVAHTSRALMMFSQACSNDSLGSRGGTLFVFSYSARVNLTVFDHHL